MQQPAENPIFKDASMRSCFNDLPLALQENIMQSGIPMHSVEDIRAYAAAYNDREKDPKPQAR